MSNKNQYNGINEDIDVEKEIEVRYSYNNNPVRGYNCAYTDGMAGFGLPELCLMDYYAPETAKAILFNAADCILNGELFDEEVQDYDFYCILELEDDGGDTFFKCGFIFGSLGDTPALCLQELNEDDIPVHPGGDRLPSWIKRGFEVWPTFMLFGGQDDSGVQE